MVDAPLRRAVFLDRDGVITIPRVTNGKSYAPRDLKDFHYYPEARAALEALHAAGLLLVVVTNQPDIGNGLMEPQVLEQMHDRLGSDLPIDLIKTCPHSQKAGCTCRKPQPGMLQEAARELSIRLEKSFMVGDRAGDIEAGARVGCFTVFIDRNYSESKPPAPDAVATSLREAAELILSRVAPVAPNLSDGESGGRR